VVVFVRQGEISAMRYAHWNNRLAGNELCHNTIRVNDTDGNVVCQVCGYIFVYSDVIPDVKRLKKVARQRIRV